MAKPIKIKSAPREFQPFLNEAEELVGKYGEERVGQKDGFIKTPAEANCALEACIRAQRGFQGLKRFVESYGYKPISPKEVVRLRAEINDTSSVRRLLAIADNASEASAFSLAWGAFDKALEKIRTYSGKHRIYRTANLYCDLASAMDKAGVKKIVVRTVLQEAFDAASKVGEGYSAYDSYRGAYKTHILCKVGQERHKAGLNKKEVYEPFKLALKAALNSEEPLNAFERVVRTLTDSGLTEEALIAVRTAKIVRKGKELKIDHHKIRLHGIIALKRHEAGAKKSEILDIFRQAIRIARAGYKDVGARYKATKPLRTYYFSAAGVKEKDKEVLMDELLEVQLPPIK